MKSPRLLLLLFFFSACRSRTKGVDDPFTKPAPAIATAEGRDQVDPLPPGLFFVARGAPGEARWEGGRARLDLHQEAYHYDPAKRQYRRLTETGGRLYAIAVDPKGRFLSYLTAQAIERGATLDRFVEPGLGAVDLTRLRQHPEKRLGGPVTIVDLVFSTEGRPLWITDGEMHALGNDGLAAVPLDVGRIAAVAGRTFAKPGKVVHYGPPQIGTRIAVDGRGVVIDGEGQAAADGEVELPSIEWSPGRRRLAFAAGFDPCDTKAASSLHVYTALTKAAAVVARGRSAFDSHWLDDERLAFDGGDGAQGVVRIHDFSGGGEQSLLAGHGAALFGLPIPVCGERAPIANPTGH